MPRKSGAKSTKGTRKNKVRTEAKCNISMPVSRIARAMRKMRLADRQSRDASIFMAGVLDYVCTEMLEGAGMIAEQQKPGAQKRPRIKPRHI